ncbi:dynamin family protein [Argonema antarcticum]|uniref:dynamin family protein n=1 Tax=Argonema antarcticum TaxID=2942763 RepID=UPI0020120A6F|nr:dynamin family protein [Argonema antarcticum]MCL1471219.1 dynamin family protein [Argonema antarcticum A004/B2]
MSSENLRQFKEYGESIFQKLESVSQNLSLPDSIPATLPKCLDLVRSAASKTIDRATSPVKIGVMGEFSSGKTLLLGSLIGYADALPISENPTTGNVTAIHLIQQEGFQTTQVEKFEVEYLSHSEVKECLYFMLKKAEERATDARLTPAQLKALRNFNANDPGISQDILTWCKSAWNSSKNLELRYLLRELVLFIRTYKAQGEDICGKHYQNIDLDTARQGLQLGDAQMDIQNLQFEDIPLAISQNSPTQLSVEFLQSSFPLIRRVNVKVKVSKEIWDLTALEGAEEFVLLDFPGLGAANSGVRDTFLSLRELAEVQTILILLNGRVPGGATANKIFTMMEQQKPGINLKDRILVGVGRFDQLPLENEGGERILDELIDESPLEDIIPLDSEPLTENSVLEKLKVLKTTVATAQAFTTQKDRIFLVSPLVELAELSKNSSNVQVGSPEFLADLDYPPDRWSQSRRLREKWSRLSEKLEQSKPRSTLAKQLADFAQNGGIVTLREAILKHVKEHGLKQLLDDTRSAAVALQRQQDVLKNILEGIQQDIPAESPNFVKLRDAIESLSKTYDEFQKDLAIKVLKDRREVAVSDAVKDELIFRIYEWSQWNLLFQQAEKGIIKLPKSVNRFDSKSNKKVIATKSDDFYPVFETAVLEVEKFANKSIQQAFKNLLDELSSRMLDRRNEIAEILTDERLQWIESNSKNYESSHLLENFVNGNIDPKNWLEGLLEECSLEENSLSTINPETLFPLVRANSHESSQAFVWGKEENKKDQKPANNQILVLRLRDEMIASAGLHLVEIVSKANQQLNNTLGEWINNIIDVLGRLLRDEVLLKDVVSEDEIGNRSIPQWLQILWQISEINLPN